MEFTDTRFSVLSALEEGDEERGEDSERNNNNGNNKDEVKDDTVTATTSCNQTMVSNGENDFDYPDIALNPALEERIAKEYLIRLNWPSGLIKSVIMNLSKTPMRYFICCDNDSMRITDARRVSGGPDKTS